MIQNHNLKSQISILYILSSQHRQVFVDDIPVSAEKNSFYVANFERSQIINNTIIHETQIDCKVGFTIRQIHLKKLPIYQYKTSRLNPFVKPCII